MGMPQMYRKPLEDMINAGASYSKIALSLGVGKSTAMRWAVEIGANGKTNNKFSKLNKSQKEKFTEMFCGGCTYHQIMDEFGISADTVRLWANNLGLPKKKSSISEILTEDKHAELEKMFRENVPIRQIALAFNVSEKRVRYWRKAAFTDLPKLQGTPPMFEKLPDDEKVELKQMYMSGTPIKRIAEHFNVSESTIRVWLRNMNVKRNRINYTYEILTEQQKQKFAEMYKSGVPFSNIGDEFGVSGDTARRWASQKLCIAESERKLTGSRARVASMINDKRRAEDFKKDYESFVSRDNMTVKYGITTYDFKKIIQALNIEKRDKNKVEQTRKIELLAGDMKSMSKAGKSNSEIAKALGVSEKDVRMQIGTSGYRNDGVYEAKKLTVLPVGERVWAIQPKNTKNLTLSYKKVPVTIEKVYPRFYDCATDNGYHVSVQIAGAKRVMQ